MKNTYRQTAIESIKKIFKDKSYTNLVINNDIKNLDNKFNALYRKSVLGTVENLLFIDWIINQVAKTKTKKMESDVLAVLRLAVYQLLFLKDSKENIVVNESVQFLKEKGNLRASKFVNAILRNILRNKDKFNDSIEALPYLDYLSIKYSYPKWLVRKWIKQFGEDKIEEVLLANNLQAPLEIRVNTLKVSSDELIKLLAERGIKADKLDYVNYGLTVSHPFEIHKTEEYKRGLFSIQSGSSMLAVEVLDPVEDSLIIDLCAAPGGKSLEAGEMMKNKGRIISRDIHKNKLSLINGEAERLGINVIETEEYDGTNLDEGLIEKADYCIVDVPCSGLGIIRRKPDIKYNKTEENLSDIAKIQYKILENASKYLKHGGELIYSTCTTNKEENISVVNKFLRENENYTLVRLNNKMVSNFTDAAKGYVEIYPHIHGMDGFFIAKIKRL